MASVRKHPFSPFWIAQVTVWVALPDHPHGGYWQRSNRSTKIPLTKPRRDALAVALEFERIGRQSYQPTGNPQQFYEAAVKRLMAAAGLEPPQKTATWREWSRQWLSERQIADGTRKKYETELARFTRYLGARAKAPLRELTHSDCFGCHEALKRDGYANGTARHTVKTIRYCLEHAKNLGFIETNPAALVETDTSGTLSKKPFTQAEIEMIFRQLEHEHEDWRIACLFGLFYGLRLKDAIGRRFDEITTEGTQRVLRFTPLKKRRKGKPIVLPLVGPLEHLKGKGLITPSLPELGAASKVFIRILRDSGVKTTVTRAAGSGYDQRDKSFHSWRHTCNTMMVNAGIDQRLRQLISDHDSAEVNARYSHASVEAMADAIRKAIPAAK